MTTEYFRGLLVQFLQSNCTEQYRENIEDYVKFNETGINIILKNHSLDLENWHTETDEKKKAYYAYVLIKCLLHYQQNGTSIFDINFQINDYQFVKKKDIPAWMKKLTAFEKIDDTLNMYALIIQVENCFLEHYCLITEEFEPIDHKTYSFIDKENGKTEFTSFIEKNRCAIDEICWRCSVILSEALKSEQMGIKNG